MLRPKAPLVSVPSVNPPPINFKIGVLDSGVGGLSVLREIHDLLPETPTLYFADQAHVPYGSRSADAIRGYVEAITCFLIAEGAGVIVIACHAASAASLHPLRQQFPTIPLVGIEPAVKPAAEATRSGVIGVLTTQATANGALYRRVLTQYADHVRVLTVVAPELVTMVEQGGAISVQDDAVLHRLIDPLVAAGADQLVLACTHFPFLAAGLRRVSDLPLVDPSAAVARQVARVLAPRDPAAGDVNRYFTSGDAATFRGALKRLIGEDAEVIRATL